MSTPYEKALSAIDAAHAQDPTKTTITTTTTANEGKETTTTTTEIPYELHYAQKCTSYLTLRSPSASETLRLAIRAQHLRRWEIPRSSYPMTRIGYHTWRSVLKTRQASLATQICLDAGYSSEDAERVGALVRKEGLKDDGEEGETQILEDVACLVFLDDQFEAFEKEHDEEKIVGILRKTWKKMSKRGHELALGIPMGERPREVVGRALEGLV